MWDSEQEDEARRKTEEQANHLAPEDDIGRHLVYFDGLKTKSGVIPLIKLYTDYQIMQMLE